MRSETRTRIRPLRRRGPLGCVLALATLAVFAAGCGGSAETEPGLTRDAFIDVVVALREAERAVRTEDPGGDSMLVDGRAVHVDSLPPDTVAALRFRHRRDSILAAHGTTEGALQEFLDRHDDVGYLTEVWDTISERLKHPASAPDDLYEPITAEGVRRRTPKP